MLFRARTKPGTGQRLRQLVWPRSGWRRAANYLWYRVVRLPGTPHNIAAGLACGAAMSFTPFIGLHFLLAAALAWVLGANIIASAIGTALGNPWTFPLIWLWTFNLGSWLMGLEPVSAPHFELTLSYLVDNAYRLLIPMAVGGLPIALTVWCAVYWPVRYLVAGFQHARRRKRERRAQRAAGPANQQEKAK